MQVKTILEQMIATTASLPLEPNNDQHIIRLHEPQLGKSQSSSKRPKKSSADVLIRNSPADAFVIKADKFPAPREFFRGDRGEARRADYIIISESKNIILYIEIKSWAGDAGHIKDQLNGAACVLAYCREAGKRYWHEKKFLDNFDQRYIGIVNTGENEKAFDTGPGTGRKIESYRRISSPHRLYFKQLL